MRSNWHFRVVSLFLSTAVILLSDVALSTASRGSDPSEAPNGSVAKDPRASVLLTTDNRAPTSQVKLIPIDPLDEVTDFGHAASLDGDYALIGDRFFGDLNHGQAFIFLFDGTEWTQSQALFPSTGVRTQYQFGVSVSLSGEFAFVGMRGDLGSGGVFVFRSDGSAFQDQAFLFPSDLGGSSNFGIALATDGTTALIGAPGDTENGDRSGSAYVYEFNGISWDRTAKLVPTDGTAFDGFGQSVSLVGDRAVVSANSGAYVFDLTSGNWEEQAKLIPTNHDASASIAQDVESSGNWVFIGSPTDSQLGRNSGAVFVFSLDKDGWSQREKLFASDGQQDDGFGASVSVSGDRLLIGSPKDDGNFQDTGSAYGFYLIDGAWMQDLKLAVIGASTQDLFGVAVDLVGNRAVVGAPSNFAKEALNNE